MDYIVNETVASLLFDWMIGKIDQDEFDETLDRYAEYQNDVRSSVDSYLAGVE